MLSLLNIIESNIKNFLFVSVKWKESTLLIIFIRKINNLELNHSQIATLR
jgi:hypothetical protein